METMQMTMPAVEAPEQTPLRRKIRKTFSRFDGLTKAQIAEAKALLAELEEAPAIRRIGWDEVLGSNEWKMRHWCSRTMDRMIRVEFVIGKAVKS